MTQATENLPKDKRFKHCREWVETTILKQIDGKNLVIAGLLAGETLLFSAVGLWGVVALTMFNGSFPQRLMMLFRSIVPWLPFVVICTMLSVVGAELAQWGERRYRQGRLAATIALVPVMPLVLAVFFRPPLFMIAPILGIGSIWLLGRIWWHLFCSFLRHLATFDYWAQLEQESEPQTNDWLYEHRNYLETKKTALIERKLRWEDMASNNPQPPSADANTRQDSWLPWPSLDHPWIRRWALPIAITCLLCGSALWQHINRIPPEVAVTPEPPSLVFWYQTSEPEASLLQDLVLAYNVLAQKQDGVPAVQGCNQVGDFPLQIYQAQITGETPDVMLISEELADRLSISWDRERKTLDTASQDSAESRTGLFTPLWPDRLWRQRLVLVISPTTKLRREAETFTTYLHGKLSAY